MTSQSAQRFLIDYATEGSAKLRSSALSSARRAVLALAIGPAYLVGTLSRILENARRPIMGDKSPKAINRHKKQDAVQKNQKKAAAFAKANPAPPEPVKKKGK